MAYRLSLPRLSTCVYKNFQSEPLSGPLTTRPAANYAQVNARLDIIAKLETARGPAERNKNDDGKADPGAKLELLASRLSYTAPVRACDIKAPRGFHLA